MKKSFRFVLTAVIIIGMILVVYYLGLRFWPFYPPLYPMWGWRFHYFGTRMWPVFPFFGMLILIVVGILVAKYFVQALRDSSISKKDELTFCPYCGKDLMQGKIIPEVQSEKL